jgi:glycolate oxidase FAD binding subunit
MTTEQVVDVVRESAASRTPLRICGNSTWLDAGRPVRTDKQLSLHGDSGIVDYVAGDLTLSVRAGTSLEEIQHVAREKDQWLPLDPYGSDTGTIGATIATASAGPLAPTFGLPRDLVLGLEFVSGKGDVIRAGGKVVKNVAGFDLTRLLTGSWGTLGILTEVTLRLYALPQSDRTFAIPLTGAPREQSALVHAIYIALVPYALQLLGVTAARAAGLGDSPVALVRLGGNGAVVDSQLRALSKAAQPREIPTTIWTALRALDGSAASVIRISSLPTRFLATAARILGEEVDGVFTSIDPRRGVMRIIAGNPLQQAEGTSQNTSFEDLKKRDGDSSEVIFERLPPDVWSSVSPSVVGDPLSRGIKKAYDPFNILNPGILGD